VYIQDPAESEYFPTAMRLSLRLSPAPERCAALVELVVLLGLALYVDLHRRVEDPASPEYFVRGQVKASVSKGRRNGDWYLPDVLT